MEQVSKKLGLFRWQEVNAVFFLMVGIGIPYIFADILLVQRVHTKPTSTEGVGIWGVFLLIGYLSHVAFSGLVSFRVRTLWKILAGKNEGGTRLTAAIYMGVLGVILLSYISAVIALVVTW